MTHLPLRQVEISAEGASACDDWPSEIRAELADPARDRNELVRDILRDIYFPALRRVKSSAPQSTARDANVPESGSP